MENNSLTAGTGTSLPVGCKMSRQRAMAHRIAPAYRRAEPSVENTSLTLLNRASLGSSEAWEQLDSLYRPFIARWFRRQNLLPADADDLTQDVLAVLARDLTKFDHNGRTGAFGLGFAAFASIVRKDTDESRIFVNQRLAALIRSGS